MPTRFTRFAITACFSLAIWSNAPGLCADPSTAQLEQLEQLIQSDKLPQAIELGQRLDEELGDSIDLTIVHAKLADALRKAERMDRAAEFFQRSVDASKRPPASTLSTDKAAIVRIAAASVLAQTKNLPEALAALRLVLAADGGLTAEQKEMSVAIALRVGSSALSTGAVTTAIEAYSLAVQHASADQMPSAMLGDGWATAIQNQDPLLAAKKLASFIEQYPQHDDAARAARACAQCLTEAGREQDATAMLDDLLERWPDSDSALEVVRSHVDVAVDLIPVPVSEWIMQKARANDLNRLDVQTTKLGLLIARRQQDFDAWTNLSIHLAGIDQTGQATSDLLGRLDSEGNRADAERFAARVIGDTVDHRDGQPKITAAVAEAVCRWAGRTERWSMLALAAESEETQMDDPDRPAAIDRLLAESLTQTGKTELAGKWWNHLVDTRNATDFATLLRCAESETATGRDATVAEHRISAARTAAGDDRFKVALVDLLDAELAVRRLSFDSARSLLEHVIRAQQVQPSLRGRAQFLIGETYYLQQDFAAAIEAYRRVEGIDPAGHWVSAALVQAGKSFEQLGRTREAAICYGNLVGRFADTSHASIARRRLAAISPNRQPAKSGSTGPNSSDASNPIIRR